MKFFIPKKKIILTCLLLFGLSLLAQKNLVPNGGFEIIKGKSKFISAAPPWKALSTVDHYRFPFFLDTEKYKGARTGKCYVGLRFQPKYKEYMYVKLETPLKEGVSYPFEMYFRLGPWSNVKLQTFAAYFSKRILTIKDKLDPEFMIDTISKKGLDGENGNWMRLSGTYTAKGGEKFLTISNFAANTSKQMVKIKGAPKAKIKEAYYFVDDISLLDFSDTSKIVLKDSIMKDTLMIKDSLAVKPLYKAGEIIQLKNIFFDTDKSELLPGSFIELNKLADILRTYKTMEIQINGHTDNTGSNERNLALSEERAQAVYEYLITQGVLNKMTYAGFGSSKPIAPNETVEGRARNRRVEVEILKQ